MGSGGSTSDNLRIRAEELESLLAGLPVLVLRAAFDHALGRVDAPTRNATIARLGQCKTRGEQIKAVLKAINSLPRAAQDNIAAGIMEIAARASLGSDD